MLRAVAIGAACLIASGCGSSKPPLPRAVSIGVGRQFQPTPGATGPMRCSDQGGRRFGVHVELFAAGHIVVVPAGIGIEPPLARDGAYVRGGRCSYPLRTREPTGVIEVREGTRATLGDLFRVWGRPLTTGALLSFTARVRAWVNGTAVTGDPRSIALNRHDEIVIVSGPSVPVHATYRFAAGL